MVASRALVALVIVVLVAVRGSQPLAAQVPAADWELTSFPGAAHALFVPADAVLATDADGRLFHSQDRGDTWQPVGLPPGPEAEILTVDPTTDAVLYAVGVGGLYRSSDTGSTWQLIDPTTARVLALAVSPADPRVLYQATSGSVLRFSRSDDGGATWQALDVVDAAASPCSLGLAMLQVHPTDPQRVFRAAECYAGRTLGSNLRHSRDQGTTWADLFVGRGRGFHPARLVGGAGTEPARLYLATSYIAPPGQGALLRSDDDGATWRESVASTEAGLGGLAYDPQAPDRVYVGAGQTSAFFSLGSGVKASADGGASWRDLGRQDLGPIGDLALSGDGAELFAATADGIWRLRFGAGGPDTVSSPRPPKG